MAGSSVFQTREWSTKGWLYSAKTKESSRKAGLLCPSQTLCGRYFDALAVTTANFLIFLYIKKYPLSKCILITSLFYKSEKNTKPPRSSCKSRPHGPQSSAVHWQLLINLEKYIPKMEAGIIEIMIQSHIKPSCYDKPVQHVNKSYFSTHVVVCCILLLKGIDHFTYKDNFNRYS